VISVLVLGPVVLVRFEKNGLVYITAHSYINYRSIGMAPIEVGPPRNEDEVTPRLSSEKFDLENRSISAVIVRSRHV